MIFIEKKTFKTKVKEFYKKHEVVIDTAGLVCSVGAIGVGAYLIGKGVGIKRVCDLPLGKFNLGYGKDDVRVHGYELTIKDVIDRYANGQMLKHFEFVGGDIKKITNCKDA